MLYLKLETCSLRKKCTYSELFWSVFSRNQTEYGEILRISPYLARMRENKDQNNSEYGHFTRSGIKSKLLPVKPHIKSRPLMMLLAKSRDYVTGLRFTNYKFLNRFLLTSKEVENNVTNLRFFSIRLILSRSQHISSMGSYEVVLVCTGLDFKNKLEQEHSLFTVRQR